MYAYSRRPFRVQYAVFQGQTLHHRCVAGVLQCVAVCCSVLQCVAVCCSVLQCVAVCCSVLQCCSMLQWIHHKYAAFQGQPLHHSCVAVVLQRVAVYCNVLQCVVAYLAVCLKCVAFECNTRVLHLNATHFKRTARHEYIHV